MTNTPLEIVTVHKAEMWKLIQASVEAEKNLMAMYEMGTESDIKRYQQVAWDAHDAITDVLGEEPVS